MSSNTDDRTSSSNDQPGETSEITFRLPRELKGRAIQVSRGRGMKLEVWMCQAVEEKLAREREK